MRNFLNKYYIHTVAMILVLCSVLRYLPTPDNLNIYTLNYYVLSYDNGFISRGLIGTITQFFMPFVKVKTLYIFFALYYTFFYLIVSNLIATVITSFKNKAFGIFLALFLFSSPSTFSFIVDFARPDIFLLTIALICILLILKQRFLLLIPILFIIAMLIHEGFLFMYAPIILMTFLYVYYIEKRDKVNLSLFITCIIILLITLFVILIFGKTNVQDVDLLYKELLSKIDIVTSKSMLEFEFLYGIKGNLAYTFNTILTAKSLVYLFFDLILLSPIFLFIYKIWCLIIIKTRESGKPKLIYILMNLSTLGSLPLFIIGIDYLRWFQAIINCNFVLLFIILYIEKIDISLYDIIPIKLQKYQNLIYFLYAIPILYLSIGSMGATLGNFPFLSKIVAILF